MLLSSIQSYKIKTYYDLDPKFGETDKNHFYYHKNIKNV